MKKILAATAISTVVFTTGVYACGIEKCDNYCKTNECDKNVQCKIDDCKNISYCSGIDLEDIKQQIINGIGLPEYTTLIAESTTNQTTETTTNMVTTEITTEATTSAQITETTTKPNVETTTETTTNSNNGSISSNSSYAQQVLDLVNAERTKYGLSKLSISNELNNVAQAKAEDMMNNNYFSHTSPTYGSPFEMMKSFGIKYNAAAENIAKGQKTPEKVVSDWLSSEGHRKNILNPAYNKMGLGFAKGNTTYWAQMFTN